MNRIAELYVKLVLAVGEHDANYVDAYYGPADWQSEVKAAKKSLERINTDASFLLAELEHFDTAGTEEPIQLRKHYLRGQLQSLIARVGFLRGRTMSFDDEAKALYDVEPPHHSNEEFDEILRQIDLLIRGKGPLIQRYEEFKKNFVIPPKKLDDVFTAAIAECRTRTKKYIEL
ncbi:MAG TPA: hypothetical protein VI758_09900, partial [Bacteroidota bacterium]